MKKVILKRKNTSVRLSGSVIRFLTSDSPELELTEEEYLEYEGQLIWLMREGFVDVVEVEQSVGQEEEQNVDVEQVKEQVEEQVRRKRSRRKAG